jgi:hypothetical protein
MPMIWDRHHVDSALRLASALSVTTFMIVMMMMVMVMTTTMMTVPPKPRPQ